MGKLIYSVMASADGYIEDPNGSIDWAIPDEELLRFINELERPARTYLYGRRMYGAMLYWETAHTTGQPRLFQEFTGIWQAAEKIVFSKTLASVSSARTRIEPAFDPGMIRQLKSAARHEMRVGGADLAGQAIKAGLIDEVRLFVVPIVLGGGKRTLPDGLRSNLELLDTQRFASGTIYLSYRPSRFSSPSSAPHGHRMPRTDRASRVIAVPPERVRAAFVDREALLAWLPPGGMTGRFERFDARPGGSYRMVLTYSDASGAPGKATMDSDIVEARFVDIVPGERVVQAVDFVSDDPAYAGTMIMTWELTAAGAGTRVSIVAEDVPDGISAEDHAAGLNSSLAQLAAYLEQ